MPCVMELLLVLVVVAVAYGAIVALHLLRFEWDEQSRDREQFLRDLDDRVRELRTERLRLEGFRVERDEPTTPTTDRRTS